MSYIGNQPTQIAFLTDSFSGDASTTVFTMSVAPANTASVLVAIFGVLQDPSTYSVSGTSLTFSAAPPSGTGNISARYLGIPASGVTTTAYRTVTEFTATSGQVTFTPPSYTAGFITVYRNGVRLGSADVTATNGTTITLATGATTGDLVTTESFLVSSVLNALPQSGGTISGNLVITGTETVPTITSPSATALTLQSGGTTAVTVNTSQNVGIGTTSPTSGLEIYRANSTTGSLTDTSLMLSTTATTGRKVNIGFGLGGGVANTCAAVIGYDVISGTGAGYGDIFFSTRSTTADSVPSERMRITYGGNFFIGYNQATSQSIIKTFATGHASGNRGGELFFGIDDGSTGGVRVKTVASSNASYNSQYVSIETHEGAVSAGERVRVVPTGGTRFACESYASVPSSTNWGVEINNTGSGSRFFGQGTGTETQIEFGNRNGTRGSIQTNSSNTVYNTTSDYRLKENIAPMTGALDKVLELKPCTYNWKVDGSDGQGFIAHELQAVVSDCVSGEKDAVDENGDPKYQMVDTSFLIATLTAAIQELKTQVDAQALQIAELKAGK